MALSCTNLVMGGILVAALGLTISIVDVIGGVIIIM